MRSRSPCIPDQKNLWIRQSSGKTEEPPREGRLLRNSVVFRLLHRRLHRQPSVPSLTRSPCVRPLTFCVHSSAMRKVCLACRVITTFKIRFAALHQVQVGHRLFIVRLDLNGLLQRLQTFIETNDVFVPPGSFGRHPCSSSTLPLPSSVEPSAARIVTAALVCSARQSTTPMV